MLKLNFNPKQNIFYQHFFAHSPAKPFWFCKVRYFIITKEENKKFFDLIKH